MQYDDIEWFLDQVRNYQQRQAAAQERIATALESLVALAEQTQQEGE